MGVGDGDPPVVDVLGSDGPTSSSVGVDWVGPVSGPIKRLELSGSPSWRTHGYGYDPGTYVPSSKWGGSPLRTGVTECTFFVVSALRLPNIITCD